jgi:hypothetical protein
MSINLKKEPRTKTLAGTIDLTPTWESLAFRIATLAVDGTTFESRKIGREELQRMASLADKWVEHTKGQQPLSIMKTTEYERLKRRYDSLEMEELRSFIEDTCFEAVYDLETINAEMLAALKNADKRIGELCTMVCNVTNQPKKVRAEDFADKIRYVLNKYDKL